MAAVSLGRAIGSGFALIKHRPASVFVWGLLLVVFVEAPILFLMGRAATETLGLWGAGGPTNEAAAQNIAFALQQRMLLVEAMMLPVLVVRVLIMAAVYRAVLEPAKRGLAYLRIGRQEAWLLLLALCISVLAGFAIVPLELLLGVSVITMMMKGAWILVGPLLGIVGLILLLWVWARLSLAAPMTFADRHFRLFESWRLTRRHGLSLLGLGVVMFLLIAALELVLFSLLAIGGAALWAGHPLDAPAILAWIRRLSIQSAGQMAEWLVPIGLVAAAVFGALNAIAIAPWASAYQQLNKASRAGA